MFYKPTTSWTWAILSVTITETITVIAIEVAYLTTISASFLDGKAITPMTRSLSTFVVLLVFGLVYQCLLLYDALSKRNTIQLIGLCIYAACLLVYSVLQIDQTRSIVLGSQKIHYILPDDDVWASVRVLVLANATITGLYLLTMCFLSFKLYYEEFAWSILQQLGADYRMKRRYFTFQLFTSLLKFDLFFFVGFLLQFVILVNNPPPAEFAILMTAIPLTFLTLSTSVFFMRRENLLGMIGVLVLHLLLLVHFIFKIVRMYQPGYLEGYLPARKCLSFFGIITMALSVATICVGATCMTNFNQGLKPHITGSRVTRDLLDDQEMEMTLLNNTRSR